MEASKIMKFILGLILITQVGCSFITTAAGSFVGNLGAVVMKEQPT
jgi:fucose permease